MGSIEPDMPPSSPLEVAAEVEVAQAAAAADAVVAGDLACIRCSYNLRGLRGDGRCPECGLPILSTLRRDPVLSLSDVLWIETLRQGAYLLAAAIVVWGVPAYVLSQLGSIAGLASLATAGPRAWPLPLAWAVRQPELAGWLFIPGFLALGLHTAGVWCVAAQEPATADAEPGLSRRRVLLALAAALPVSVGLWWVVASGFTSVVAAKAFRQGTWAAWAGFFALLDGAVHVLLFDHLRRLASRVLDASLLRETRAIGVVATVALAVIAAGCFLMLVDDELVAVVMVGSLLLMLAGIGAAGLMFAFVRAFGLAAAAARAGGQTSYAAVVTRGEQGGGGRDNES